MLGFPGFGMHGAQSPSGDPALPSDLVGPYAAEQGRDNDVSEQRAAMLGSRIEQSFARLMESTLTALATAALNEANKTPAGHQQVVNFQQFLQSRQPGAEVLSAPAWPLDPSGAAQVATEAARAATPPSVPEGRSTPAAPSGDGGHVPTFAERYKEGYHEVADGNMTMGSIARKAAAPAAAYLSQRNENWIEGSDENGAYYARRDSSTGEEDQASKVYEGDARYQHMGSKIRRDMFIGGNLTRFAAGEGSVGALGAFAAKTAGPIGLAIGGATLVASQLEKQNEAASTYRSSFGEEGTGAFAAKDRLGEMMAGAKGWGSIGGDRARAQFQQASGMGLRGDRRDQATDFSSDMYLRFGMDTSESMAIVERAIETGNTSLKDFSEAIAGVSKAAVEAGRSSKEAIKDFVEAQEFVSKNVVAGGASLGVTEQVSQVFDALPTTLQRSVGGVKGMASMLSQQNVMAMAALSGQDPTAAWAAIQNPATAESQANDTMSQIGQQIVTIMASAMGMSPDDLKGAVAERTGGQTVSTEEQWAIFAELAGGNERATGIMSLVLQQVASTLRVNVDQTQLMNLFFEACTGSFGTTTTEQKKQATSGWGPLKAMATGKSPSGQDSVAITGYDKVSKPSQQENLAAAYSSASGQRAPSDWDKQKTEILDNLGYKQTRTDRGTFQGTPEDEKAFAAYVEMVNKSGTGNKAIEELLSSENAQDLKQASGTNDLGDVKYRVKDKSGKARDMSLAEIISSGNQQYLGQVNSGSAGVVGANPNDNPTSIADITNIRVEIEAVGDLKGNIRSRQGPSDDQRAGTPASGNRTPSSYSRYGSQ